MNLSLTIYEDDNLIKVKRVAEADRLKIPYRVAKYIAESLDSEKLRDEDEIFKFIINSLDKVDKIIKATFDVSETELGCIDVMELGTVVSEVYKWGIEKFNSFSEGDSKNVHLTAGA